MLLNDSEALARLASPDNLMNRLRSASSTTARSSAMNLFGVGKGNVASTPVKAVEVLPPTRPSFNPFPTPSAAVVVTEESSSPSIDDLVPNNETQVKLTSIHDDSLDLLSSAITELRNNVSNIKPEKLPAVVSAASKIVDQIRKERVDAAKAGLEKKTSYVFYTPSQRKLSEYQEVSV